MSDTNGVTDAERNHLARNFTNTALGLLRIARNLGLSADEVVPRCREAILSTPLADFEIRGKNYYVHARAQGAVLTINRSSLGIITAKRLGQR